MILNGFHVLPHRCPLLKEAVRVLDEPRLIEGNSDLKACVVWGLLPFLVVTSALPDSPDLQLATCVAQSSIISQHNLTQGWAYGKRIRKWFHNKCILIFFVFENTCKRFTENAMEGTLVNRGIIYTRIL